MWLKSYELEIEEKLTGSFDVCKLVSKKNAAILFFNNKGEKLIEWMMILKGLRKGQTLVICTCPSPHLTWTCWNSPSHLQPHSWLLHLTSSSKISRLNALSTYAFNKEKIRYNTVLILAVV